MSVGAGEGFLEEGVVLLGVSCMGGVKIFRLVTGFRDGQSLFHSV